MRALAALLIGEALLLGGIAWLSPPLALVAAGAQVVAGSLLWEPKP